MTYTAPRGNRGPRAGRRSRQSGVTLIEVMVSVLIMGIGLLGIAALQTTALRNGQSSLERSQAVIQSYAITDAMRANRANALAGAYDTSGFQCAGHAGGTLADNDLQSWLASLKGTMGVGGDATTCGSVACDATTGICIIAVRWDDGRAVDNGVAGDSTRDVETRVLL
ncbi:MAG: type IV pilus modification protein PilV [Xanthomonadales bacterium]|nr:type IV pilus modification protein PilV [Xanthomonadales bacterium]